MKRLFAAIATLALLAIPAMAQTYNPVNVTLGFTSVAASTATNGGTSAKCYVGQQQNVAFQLSFKSSAAGTGKVIAYVVPSVDGTLYDTTKSFGIEAAAVSAGTQVTVTTNLATGGYGWYKVSYITNADASLNATNILFKYSQKKNAP